VARHLKEISKTQMRNTFAQWDETARGNTTEVQELVMGEYRGHERQSKMIKPLGNLKLWISSFYL